MVINSDKTKLIVLSKDKKTMELGNEIKSSNKIKPF